MGINIPFQNIKKKLSAIYPNDMFFYSLGRFALLEALRILKIKDGDLVLLPEFICRDLIAPIHVAGAKPLFYKVNENLRPEALPQSHRIKAVVVVNYFGFPQDISEFRKYCDTNGAVLIEDNAHGFLSRDENDCILGSRGDIGILSIRKTFLLPNGAVLLLNRSSSELPRPKISDYSNTSLPWVYQMKSRFLRVQNKTGIPLLKQAESVMRYFRKIKTGNEFPKPEELAEKIIPGSPEIHLESLRELMRCDFTHEAGRRRVLYDSMEKRLKDYDIQPVYSHLPNKAVPYGYPFRADSRTATKVKMLAKGMGYTCPYWPDLPQEVTNNAPWHHKNIYWVNFL